MHSKNPRGSEATKSYEAYQRREKALKRNKKRREWERKNAGKSYARIKREEADRKFRGWLLGGVAGFAGWLLLFTIEVSFAIAVGIFVGIFTGIWGGLADTWKGK